MTQTAGPISGLLEGYWSWLRDRTALRDVNGWVEVTTPFLDRHNDYLQFYIRDEGGRLIFTDDGQTIQDLKMSGCNINSKHRQELLQTVLNGFGIERLGDELTARTSYEKFAITKHHLVQAMLAVGNFFYLAPANVASVFWEDVEAWLAAAGIRFVPRVRFSGRSGYDHVFDFVIPRSRHAPERVIEAINRPTRERALSSAFAWVETRESREPDSRAYAFLNDSEQDPPAEVIDALRAYDITPVPWSERESVRAELAA